MSLDQLWSTLSSLGRRQSIPYLPLSPGSPRSPFLGHTNQRSSPRAYLAAGAATLILLGFLAHIISFAPAPYNRNLAFYHAPAWLHPILSPFYSTLSIGSTAQSGPNAFLSTASGPPEPAYQLLNGTWPGDWVIPELTPAQYTIHDVDGYMHESLTSPALIMLHVFSSASPAGRERRDFLRRHSPLRSVPRHFRHLVDVRYIVFDSDPSTWEKHQDSLIPLGLGEDEYARVAKLEAAKGEEQLIKRENAKWRDVQRMEGIAAGDGFKATWEWIRWAGGAQAREGHWVIKCSDEMLPVLPNIIPTLMNYDPTIPTYLGSSLPRKAGYDFYFDGMMYGFSWGVLKTLSEAPLDARLIHAGVPEDAMIGELMYQLPSKPLCRDLLSRAETDDLLAFFDEDKGDKDNADVDSEFDEGNNVVGAKQAITAEAEVESEAAEEPASGEDQILVPDAVEDNSDDLLETENQTPAIDAAEPLPSVQEEWRRLHSRDFNPDTETYTPDQHRSSWPHRLKALLPFRSKWDTNSAHRGEYESGTDSAQLASAGAYAEVAYYSGACLDRPMDWRENAPRGGWRSGLPPTPSDSGSGSASEDGTALAVAVSEDERTGLVRLDLQTTVGVRGGYGAEEGVDDVLAWRIARRDGRSFDTEAEFQDVYKSAWHKLKDELSESERHFEWHVPDGLRWLSESDALNLEGI